MSLVAATLANETLKGERGRPSRISMISLLFFTPADFDQTAHEYDHRGGARPPEGRSLATTGAVNGHLWGFFTGLEGSC
jgi:hypothetical protein